MNVRLTRFVLPRHHLLDKGCDKLLLFGVANCDQLGAHVVAVLLRCCPWESVVEHQPVALSIVIGEISIAKLADRVV